MALPPHFRSNGCLDEGVHETTWAEFSERFGFNETRNALLRQLLGFCRLLHVGQCAELFIDGSFVTDKAQPGDVDICFSTEPMDDSRFFLWSRKTQKQAFPLLDAKVDDEGLYLDFFQTSSPAGRRKGVVCLRLHSLPPHD